jgi:hypothetical protein
MVKLRPGNPPAPLLDVAAPPESSAQESFEYDSSHCYGVTGSCAIQMWRGEVLESHIPTMERRWRRLIERTGSFAILVVVLPSAPPPSPARREEIKRLYNGLAPHIRAVGTVLEDQGIKGTTGSMVMTTIMLMSKTPYPYKNGTSIAPIATWLCEQVRGLDRQRLVDKVETLRRQYESVCLTNFNEPLVPKLRSASR